jgi:hypothetical protein
VRLDAPIGRLPDAEIAVLEKGTQTTLEAGITSMAYRESFGCHGSPSR